MIKELNTEQVSIMSQEDFQSQSSLVAKYDKPLAVEKEPLDPFSRGLPPQDIQRNIRMGTAISMSIRLILLLMLL